MDVSVKSSIKKLRIYIKGANTSIDAIKLYTDTSTQLDISGASITSSTVPTVGTLDDILAGVTNLEFGTALTELNLTLASEVDIYKIGLEFTTVQTLVIVQLQSSTSGWKTVYDSNHNSVVPSASMEFNTYFSRTVDDTSGIITDIEENEYFDPKVLIWDNDKTLQDYFERIMSYSQHYDVSVESTATNIILTSINGVYPDAYRNNLMINWIQAETVSASSVNLSIGTLGAKAIEVDGSTTVDLDKATPYIAIYNSSKGLFQVISGSGTGSTTVIKVSQTDATSFSVGDCVHFNGTKMVEPVMDEDEVVPATGIVTKVATNLLYVATSGMIEINNTDYRDTDNAAYESGQIYFVDYTNPKNLVKEQPTENWVQGLVRITQDNSKIYMEILDTPLFHATSLSDVYTSGTGLYATNEVLHVDFSRNMDIFNPESTKVIGEDSLAPVEIQKTNTGLENGGYLSGKSILYTGYQYKATGDGWYTPPTDEYTWTGSGVPNSELIEVSWLSNRDTMIGTSLKEANGYSTLPNGIIMQWGFSNNPQGSVNTEVSFPISFPNQCFSVTIGPESTGSFASNLTTQCFVNTVSKSGFYLKTHYDTDIDAYWFAIGY